MSWSRYWKSAVLHSVNIVHGDLKPENIVLVDDTLVQIRELAPDGIFKEKVGFIEAFFLYSFVLHNGEYSLFYEVPKSR